MKNIIVLVILISLTQCRYFNVSPVDGIITQNLKEKPAEKKLLGTWKIDDFSHETLKEYGYKYSDVELILKDSGFFVAKNFPDFLFDYSPNPSLTYSNYEGKWEVVENQNQRWVLYINFTDKLSTSYDLYLMNDSLIIWAFIGDPDTGERFLFKKTK